MFGASSEAASVMAFGFNFCTLYTDGTDAGEFRRCAHVETGQLAGINEDDELHSETNVRRSSERRNDVTNDAERQQHAAAVVRDIFDNGHVSVSLKRPLQLCINVYTFTKFHPQVFGEENKKENERKQMFTEVKVLTLWGRTAHACELLG